MTNAATSQEHRSIRVSKSLGRSLWAGALVLVAALIGCLVIYDNASFLGFAIHADSLHVALQTWDYSTHARALEGFSMSRASSIVPDLVIYSAAQLITGSWRFASLAYGVLSLIALSAVAGFIVQEFARCGWRTATQAFLLVTLPILMLELPITAASMHMHVFLPTNHGGPFILALAALAISWAWLRRPTKGKLLLLFMLVAAGVLSDLLFVIACVGPTAVALAYSVLRGRIPLRTAVPLLACLGLGTILGRALERLLVKDGMFDIDWAVAPEHVWALLASLGELWTAAPLTALVGFALPMAAFVAYPLTAGASERPASALDPVAYWWVLSASSMLATLVATSLVYEEPWHYRYMMPVLWWPVIWTTALVVRMSGPVRSAAIPAGLAGVTVVSGYAYFSPGIRTPALLSLHHPLEACLLEGQQSAGLKAGLGDYWHARYVEASSDWKLQVDQIEPDGSGMWWSNDKFWYTHDIHDGARPPDYNYIIMPGLDERAIAAHYGAHDRTLDCGGSAIWVYDDPAAVRRALVRISPPLYATFLEPDQGIDRICIPADRFLSAAHTIGPGHLAPLAGPLVVGAEVPDDGRPRTWGPAFGLPRGRWTIALAYSLASDAPGGNRWDIAAGWGNRTLYEAPLTATDGAPGTVRTELDLEAPVQGIEIRTFLAARGAIAIHGAEIARTGVAGAEDCPR
jgi:hypothetical protein